MAIPTPFAREGCFQVKDFSHFTYVSHVTKCKDEFKIGSNPVIMPFMVWYGMVWRGRGNLCDHKYFLYISDVITRDTMILKEKEY